MHELALVKIRAGSLREARCLLDREFDYATEWGVDYYTVVAVVTLEEPSRHFTDTFVGILEEQFRKWHSGEIKWTLLKVAEYEKKDPRFARYLRKKFRAMREYRWVSGSHFIVVGDPVDVNAANYGAIREDGHVGFSVVRGEWDRWLTAIRGFTGSTYYFVVDYHW